MPRQTCSASQSSVQTLTLFAQTILVNLAANKNMRQAPRMADYFLNTTVMISAASCAHVDEGFLHDREIRYSPALGRQKMQYFRDSVETSLYMIHRDHWPTERRGWCAQERFLAPRIIHFLADQVIWECEHGMRFESSNAKNKDYQSVTAKLNEIRQLSRRASDDKRPFLQTSQHLSSSSYEDVHNRARRQLDMWYLFIEEYSQRDLSYISDKLPAAAGFASLMDDSSLGSYLAGIWSNAYVSGLSWSSSPPIQRSCHDKSRNVGDTYVAPSWSWASQTGTRVQHHLRQTSQSHSRKLSHHSHTHNLELCHAKFAPDGVLVVPYLSAQALLDMNEDWASKWALHLVSHNVILKPGSKSPYMQVSMGSSITVEGCFLECYPSTLCRPSLHRQTHHSVISAKLDDQKDWESAYCPTQPRIFIGTLSERPNLLVRPSWEADDTIPEPVSPGDVRRRICLLIGASTPSEDKTSPKAVRRNLWTAYGLWLELVDSETDVQESVDEYVPTGHSTREKEKPLPHPPRYRRIGIMRVMPEAVLHYGWDRAFFQLI